MCAAPAWAAARDVLILSHRPPAPRIARQDVIMNGMNRRFSCIRTLIGAAFCCVLVALPLVAGAATLRPTTTSTTNAAATSSTVSLAGSTFTLSTNTPTISEYGAFDWSLRLSPSKALTSAVVRFDVVRDGGALVYRRTRYFNSIDAKKKPLIAEQFTRALAGLGMYEGRYRIEVTVTGVTKNGRETAVLTGDQYIYNEERRALRAINTVHYTAPPLRNTKGVFVDDPAGGLSEAQRSSIDTLASLALTNSRMHLTLFISPLLLEDWEAIAKGYQYLGIGDQKIPGETAVSTRYSVTLDRLKNAIAGGRLTVGTTGFSDPNLTKLSQAGLTDDIPIQYERGLSTLNNLRNTASKETSLNTSIETSLTAPLGTAFESSTFTQLKNAGVNSVIVPRTAVTAQKTNRGRTENGMTVLIADDELSRSITSQNATSFAETAFARYRKQSLTDAAGEKRSAADTPVVAATVLTAQEARNIATNLTFLAAQGWVENAAPSALIPRTTEGKNRLNTLTLSSVPLQEPSKKERKIYRARRAAEGLIFALDENVTALDAREDSLIAESGAPIDKGGNEAVALKADYAAKAQKAANNVFDKVTVKIASVTLSGSSGEMPITIRNGTKAEVRVVLHYKTSSKMDIDAKTTQTIALPPQETFLEPKVSMRGSSGAPLTVSLSAGNYRICGKTVKISASFLDNIAIVVIVMLSGLALLVFIYRKVKGADPDKNLFDNHESSSERTHDKADE